VPGDGLFNVGVAANVQPFLELLSPHPNGKNFGDGTAEYDYQDADRQPELRWRGSSLSKTSADGA
jgi:hypothetical protein